MQTAIIVGGSGFIGGHLAGSLLNDGWRVHIVDLLEPSGLAGVDFSRGDVRQSLTSSDLPSRPGLVVNLAAVHREPGHEHAEYFETNVTGAKNVLAMCDVLEATDLIFTSSISVYGTSEKPLDDDHELDHTTAYGESKAHAEDLHRAWGLEDTSRSVSIVRPAAIFGPGEGGNFTRLAASLGRRRFVYPGRRDTIKGCGYVVDLVSAMRYMHGRERNLTYNFAFPRPHTLEEICEELCRVGSFRAPWGTLPLSLMRGTGRVGDIVGPVGRATGLSVRRIEKLVTSTNVQPNVLLSTGFEHQHDLASAFADWFASEPHGQFV